MTLLRPYQTGAIEKIEDAIARGVKRLMLMLPTGGGKTLIASTMTATRRRVIFVVPRLELVIQTYEKFQQAGIDDVGIIQAFNPLTDSSRPIQIASVQTLQNRNLPPADLVFVDEAHILRNFYSDWFTRPEWSAVPFVGLSATPWTKGLGKLYQELIIASTTQELIDQGHLSDFRVFAPSHPDLSGVHTVAGDYHEGELGVAMDKQPLVADIVETWLKLGKGRPTLCFAVNRVHAEHIQTKFLEAGVRAGYIDCFTKDEARRDIRRKFASGEYEVVCNVDVLTMGVDWDVRCIILARPTKSEMRFVQAVGRGLRPAQGKDYCLILDHSDTSSQRLGFVTDIHHDRLDDGKTRQSSKRDNVRLPKECPQCACLRPIHTNVCPNCGFVAKPVNKVFTVDGELHELRKDKIIDRDQVVGELKAIALERGWKPGAVYEKVLDKGVVSKLEEIMKPENLTRVQAWYEQLPPKHKREWAAPTTVFKHCPVFAKEPPVDPKPKMTKAEEDRMALAAALEENHRLKQQKEDERFTPTDTAENVAACIVGMFTRSKAVDIARRILARVEKVS